MLLTQSYQLPSLGRAVMMERPQSMVETLSDFDLHQFLVPTTINDILRPRDAADDSSGPSSDAGSFFVPEPLSRSNSIYSFSRASLGSQLGSLTSMSLPQAESLAASITALPTARKAVRALNSAADQIMSWTKKALKVLKNLDADDDAEWAAAAGRDALDDTDKTIHDFEHLISVYVLSIEELQARSDIGNVRHEELSAVVEQMETTLDSWELVRINLKKLHEQIELAMEWEELWNTVLADVGTELDGLSQAVFEMEEKRHKAYIAQTPIEPSHNFDLKELENFIEDPAKKRENVNARFSMSFEASPLDSPVIENSQDDTDLLSLFARMQPLRASLDFLPMRLSVWQQRAESLFPTACRELDDKRERLEKNWSQLQEEAETLRRELSEDRWVVVFRNAGRQAQKMLDSVERSVVKTQEAIDEGYQRSNPTSLAKRVESFEAKKVHYMPAVHRVLNIIQKGLKDRLTVNGEVLRLHRDLSMRTRDLEDTMDGLLIQLEPVTPRHGGRLRESMSSIVSADRSLSSGTMAGTPGTSPASSVDLTPQTHLRPTYKYGLNGYSKPRPTSRPPPASANRRASHQQLRPSTPSGGRGVSPGPPSRYRQGVYKPPTVSAQRRPSVTLPEKPRWSAVVGSTEADKAAGYVRPASTTPTSTQFTPRSFSSSTTIPLRSPLSRDVASSPQPLLGHLSMRASNPHLRSFAERIGSTSPMRSDIMGPVPYHRSRNMTPTGTIRAPSSLAVHKNQQSPLSNGVSISIPLRPLSSLTRSVGPGSGRHALPVRVASRAENPKHHTPRSSLDSTRSTTTPSVPGQEHDSYGEEDEDDQLNEHGSTNSTSPLSRRTVTTRPPSSLAGTTRGKRTSMLPIPVGSGRLSSVGFNP